MLSLPAHTQPPHREACSDPDGGTAILSARPPGSAGGPLWPFGPGEPGVGGEGPRGGAPPRIGPLRGGPVCQHEMAVPGTLPVTAIGVSGHVDVLAYPVFPDGEVDQGAGAGIQGPYEHWG